VGKYRIGHVCFFSDRVNKNTFHVKWWWLEK